MLSTTAARLVSNRRIAALCWRQICADLGTNVQRHSFKPYRVIGRALSTGSASVLRPNANESELQRPSEATFDHDLPLVSINDRRISVGWDTRTWSRFHHIWLRDHCRCPACFHPQTFQRLVNTFDIPPDIGPLGAEATAEGLRVTWPEGDRHSSHVSTYPWKWLRYNSYDPRIPNAGRKDKILWGARIAAKPPSIQFEEAMDERNESGIHKWLSNVDTFGFCFVKNVPPTPEATEALARRISFIRETQYGTFWDFKADLAKGDTAYTELALSAHTDNTYYTDAAGLQLFHLIQPAPTGGATLLVDGFYIASLMAALHPTLHDVLARVPVAAHAAGESQFLYSPKRGAPVLEYDPHAAPTEQGAERSLLQVRWNNHDRSAMRAISPDAVEEWYEAARVWDRLVHSPDSEFWVPLQAGTAVVIDNHRVMHGRSEFEGPRRMCGAYIGWDEYRSRLAVLEERFGEGSPDGTASVRSVWSTRF